MSSDSAPKPDSDASLDVLIVEDEVLIAMDLEIQIEEAGHSVVGMAVDVDSCQAAARTARPDVVLMDLRLRGGDCGEDAARWLREELDVPCIFLSGNIDEARVARLNSLSPVAIIGKPLLSGRLTAALAKVCHGDTV
ncbi:response regulator [Jannaschia sp. 2305UL9-9]|uniref:response regulator n=1 Tax=Jannaschia sp. 2305UL9-9 TaxID=3121638 RepID=UPI0035299189